MKNYVLDFTNNEWTLYQYDEDLNNLPDIKGYMFSLSNSSLEKMNGVHPNVVNFMKELIKESPFDFKVTCGVRTAEEQNHEYQKGRTIFLTRMGKNSQKLAGVMDIN